jgi:hypothetical protein
VPAVQLFDRRTARWVEFSPLTVGRAYRIGQPGRYLDASGGLLVRFVNRGENSYFLPQLRMEGEIS